MPGTSLSAESEERRRHSCTPRYDLGANDRRQRHDFGRVAFGRGFDDEAFGKMVGEMWNTFHPPTSLSWFGCFSPSSIL